MNENVSQSISFHVNLDFPWSLYKWWELTDWIFFVIWKCLTLKRQYGACFCLKLGIFFKALSLFFQIWKATEGNLSVVIIDGRHGAGGEGRQRPLRAVRTQWVHPEKVWISHKIHFSLDRKSWWLYTALYDSYLYSIVIWFQWITDKFDLLILLMIAPTSWHVFLFSSD